jgi:hypothetical protein
MWPHLRKSLHSCQLKVTIKSTKEMTEKDPSAALAHLDVSEGQSMCVHVGLKN